MEEEETDCALTMQTERRQCSVLTNNNNVGIKDVVLVAPHLRLIPIRSRKIALWTLEERHILRARTYRTYVGNEA